MHHCIALGKEIAVFVCFSVLAFFSPSWEFFLGRVELNTGLAFGYGVLWCFCWWASGENMVELLGIDGLGGSANAKRLLDTFGKSRIR